MCVYIFSKILLALNLHSIIHIFVYISWILCIKLVLYNCLFMWNVVVILVYLKYLNKYFTKFTI